MVPADAPDRVYLSPAIPGGKVSLLWGTPESVRLLLTEFRGRAYIEKLIEPATNVERVELGDGRSGSRSRTCSCSWIETATSVKAPPDSQDERSSGSRAT